MSAIVSIGLLLGGAAAFLLAKGPERISDAINSGFDNIAGPAVQGPIDEGNSRPEEPSIVPGRTTIPTRRQEIPTSTQLPVQVRASAPEPIVSQGPQIQTARRQTIRTTDTPVRSNVQSGLSRGQQFQGGGRDFIGGTVRKTSITRNSTLGFIASRLGVSASKAASIRRDLRGGLKGVDLGTNTGSGQKIPTTNRAGQTSSQVSSSKRKRVSDSAKQAAAERARQVFDAGSISNF